MNNLHLQDGKVAFRWSRWRNKKRQEVSYCLMVLFSGAVLLGAGGLAVAGPTGGQVTGGTGTISQSGTTTTVDQTSNVLQINWQTFSTAPNETVNFDQPNANAVAINRVVGGVPSYLQGALNANGRVYILNSAGVTFTGTSRVNVGALLATTAMSIDGDVSGLASFSAPAGSGGSVINQGSITVSNGGFAILAAPYVQNTGFIQANLGTVALAGTNSFTLDLRGDGLINFVVPAGTAQEIVKDGQKVGVDNAGTIRAQSGQVIISANVASQVVNAVVNMTGVVDADAFASNGSGGTVMVTSAGDINLGGTISAQGAGTGAGGQIITKAVGADKVQKGAVLNAAGAPGQGGQIEVSGHDVTLDGNIHAGSGGELLIDPASININAAREASIHAHLVAGTGVTLDAAKFINFTVGGGTHSLVGGNGDLTLTAGSSINFAAKNYIIKTGAGDVTLTATNGNIGNSTHRLSVVSGVGVNQAGNIVLDAGKNAYLKNVTVKSVPGASSGSRHAFFRADAGNSINIAGAVDVEASAIGTLADAHAILLASDVNVAGAVTVKANAHGSGSRTVAHALLVAAKDFTGTSFYHVTGAKEVHFGKTIDVEAHARGNDTGRVDAGASALLAAADTITVDGELTMKASAVGSNAAIVRAHQYFTLGDNISSSSVAGEYHFRATGAKSIDLEAGIDVVANAQGNHAGSVSAKTGASFDANSVAVDGLAIDSALAQGSHAGSVKTRAGLWAYGGISSHSGISTGSTISRAGNIEFGKGLKLTANAIGHDARAVHARAIELLVAGNSGTTVGSVDIDGPETVTATAIDMGGSSGTGAKATADVLLLAPHIDVSGPATVLAKAEGRGSSGVHALAMLVAANSFSNIGGPSNGQLATHAQDINFGGAIDVEAFANGGAPHVDASGEVLLAGEDITVNGKTTLKATATGNYAGQIRGLALLVAAGDLASSFSTGGVYRHVVDGADQIDFVSGINVSANVQGSYAAFVAKAKGSVAGDSVTFGGPVTVTALANALDASTFVRARAEWFVYDSSSSQSPGGFNIFGGEKIHFDNALTVTANAVDNGPGIVGAVPADLLALAEAGLWAGSFEVDGPVKFTATATNKSGTAAIAGALADAHLRVGSHRSFHSGTSGTSSSLVGNVDITFKKGIQLQAVTDGQLIDSNASALEYLTLAGRDITVAGGITGIASATGHGAGSDLPHMVVGSANAVLLGSDINVKGPVTIHANANGTASSHIRAFALLVAANDFSNAGDGQLGTGFFASHAQDIQFGNAIDVEAVAKGHFASSAINAEADILLAADSITVDGKATVKATATGDHAGVIRARALLLAAGNVATSLGTAASSSFFFRANAAEQIDFVSGIDVTVDVQGSDAGRLTDKAKASIYGESVTVGGPIVIDALADGNNVSSLVRANAELFVEGSITSHSHSPSIDFAVSGADKIHLANAVTVTATAEGSNVGQLRAIAEGSLFAGRSSGRSVIGSIEVDGPVKVTATAVNKGSSDVIGGAQSKAKFIVGADYSKHVASSGFSSNLGGNVDINFKKSLQVQAVTEGGRITSTASAAEFINLAGRDIRVNGNITAGATATGHGTSGHFAHRVIATDGIFVTGGIHSGSTGSVDFRERFGASSIILNGNVDIFGAAIGGDLSGSVYASGGARLMAGRSEDAVAIPATSPGGVGKITVAGEITMKQTADNSGGYVGVAFASEDLVVAAAQVKDPYSGPNRTVINFGSNDVINLKGGIDIEVNADGGNVAYAAVGTDAVNLAGIDVTVGGNAVVFAHATGHGFALGSSSYYPNVYAFAGLFVDGGSTKRHSGSIVTRTVDPASSVVFKGFIDVKAHTEGSHLGSASAFAFSSLDAAKVHVKGPRTVSSTVVVH